MQTKTPGCLKARTKKPQRSTARQLILNKTLLSYSKNTFFECVCVEAKPSWNRVHFYMLPSAGLADLLWASWQRPQKSWGRRSRPSPISWRRRLFHPFFFCSVIKYKKNDITIPCQFEKEMPLEKNNVLYFCICEFFSSFFLLFSSSSSLLVGSSLLCATLKLALANAVLYFHWSCETYRITELP